MGDHEVQVRAVVGVFDDWPFAHLSALVGPGVL